MEFPSVHGVRWGLMGLMRFENKIQMGEEERGGTEPSLLPGFRDGGRMTPFVRGRKRAKDSIDSAHEFRSEA